MDYIIYNSSIMKKAYILLVTMALTAGTAFAQSNDSVERAKQQQELLKQQKQAEAKAQRELKEQQKEQEQAFKKELDRKKREQAKAENKIRTEQKKAEKERRRQGHYAAWGRKPNLTADPYATIVTARRSYGTNNLYNSVGFNLGAVIDYHHPIARHWDFNIGLGYRYTNYYYSHLNAGATDFNGKETSRHYNTILLPIKLSHINKANDMGWYLGVAPGFNFGFQSIPNGAKFNKYRCDITIGNQKHWLIFQPGFEIYANLLPTYTTTENNAIKIHEFGIRFKI